MHNSKWKGRKEEKRLTGEQLENTTTTTKTNVLKDSWEGAMCQLTASSCVIAVWSSCSQTVHKSSLVFNLVHWDSHHLQPSPALCNLAAEARMLGLCITWSIPAIKLADHESSGGPRCVAWEVVKKQLGTVRTGMMIIWSVLGFFFFLLWIGMVVMSRVWGCFTQWDAVSYEMSSQGLKTCQNKSPGCF